MKTSNAEAEAIRDKAWAATSVIGALSALRKTSDGMLLMAAVIRRSKEENEATIQKIKELDYHLVTLAMDELRRRER